MKRTVVAVFSAMLLIGIVAVAAPVLAGAKIDVTVVMHNARNEEIVWGIAITAYLTP